MVPDTNVTQNFGHKINVILKEKGVPESNKINVRSVFGEKILSYMGFGSATSLFF